MNHGIPIKPNNFSKLDKIPIISKKCKKHVESWCRVNPQVQLASAKLMNVFEELYNRSGGARYQYVRRCFFL